MSAAPATLPHKDLRHAFPWLIATLVAVHACMAVTRVSASLWVLRQGYGEWTVGVLLSLFALAPIALAMWAGRQADKHGFHRPVAIGVLMAGTGAVVALASESLWAIGFSCLACGGAVAMTAAVASQLDRPITFQ